MRKIITILLIAALLAVGCTPLEDGSESKTESSSKKEQTSSTPDSSLQESMPESSEEQSVVSEEGSSKETSSEIVYESSDEEPSEEPIVSTYDYKIDIEPYMDYIMSENLLLVNKENRIDDSFEPENLVDITYTRTDRAKEKMNATAEMALRALLEEAAANGYKDVTVTSGYRSYAKQSSLYNYYIQNEMNSGKSREDAIAAVNQYSAIPGTSEHHTGLCVDMHNLPAASQTFGNTEAGKWLAANAHHFGFILRYPADKVEITGYMYEPWHFRFVGLKHAYAIYESGMSLEEYVESLAN